MVRNPRFVLEMDKSKAKGSKHQCQNDEEKLLSEVMKLSEEEHKKEKDRKKEIEKMEKTLALSSREESERYLVFVLGFHVRNQFLAVVFCILPQHII